MDDANFSMDVLERMRILTRVAADCAVSSGRLKRRLAKFLLAGNRSIPAEVRAEVYFSAGNSDVPGNVMSFLDDEMRAVVEKHLEKNLEKILMDISAS